MSENISSIKHLFKILVRKLYWTVPCKEVYKSALTLNEILLLLCKDFDILRDFDVDVSQTRDSR